MIFPSLLLKEQAYIKKIKVGLPEGANPLPEHTDTISTTDSDRMSTPIQEDQLNAKAQQRVLRELLGPQKSTEQIGNRWFTDNVVQVHVLQDYQEQQVAASDNPVGLRQAFEHFETVLKNYNTASEKYSRSSTACERTHRAQWNWAHSHQLKVPPLHERAASRSAGGWGPKAIET